jgi:hypothetical protein
MRIVGKSVIVVRLPIKDVVHINTNEASGRYFEPTQRTTQVLS